MQGKVRCLCFDIFTTVCKAVNVSQVAEKETTKSALSSLHLEPRMSIS
jgi:hypothetical protein